VEEDMLDKPQIVRTEPQPAAVIHFTIPRAEIEQVMGPGMAQLLQAVKDQGIDPIGPIYSHHFRMDPEVFDFEIGIPVAKPVAEAGRVKPGTFPAAARVARTTYRGPHEGLAAAWGEFEAWIDSQGLEKAPDLWERYVANPDVNPDPATWETELNRPLAS
jgi:effector-binding domain-containing protein